MAPASCKRTHSPTRGRCAISALNPPEEIFEFVQVSFPWLWGQLERCLTTSFRSRSLAAAALSPSSRWIAERCKPLSGRLAHQFSGHFHDFEILETFDVFHDLLVVRFCHQPVPVLNRECVYRQSVASNLESRASTYGPCAMQADTLSETWKMWALDSPATASFGVQAVIQGVCSSYFSLVGFVKYDLHV
jgi:hypothetical protein